MLVAISGYAWLLVTMWVAISGRLVAIRGYELLLVFMLVAISGYSWLLVAMLVAMSGRLVAISSFVAISGHVRGY